MFRVKIISYGWGCNLTLSKLRAGEDRIIRGEGVVPIPTGPCKQSIHNVVLTVLRMSGFHRCFSALSSLLLSPMLVRFD